jgi:hypothetical protein
LFVSDLTGGLLVHRRSVVRVALTISRSTVVSTLLKKKMPTEASPSERPAQGSGSGPPAATPTAGAANQGERRQSGGRRGQQQRETTPKAPKFEGRCDDLSGHVYDYASPRQAADQYTKTTREICEYIGRTYKYGADTKMALEQLALPTFTAPTDPAANAT